MKTKQRIIFEYVKTNNQITTKEALQLIGSDYFSNGVKHIGSILGRMVKEGILKRVRGGVFELNDNKL